MRADVLAEIPNLDTTRLITGYQLALVWVNDSVVDWSVMVILSLNLRRPE